MINADSTRAHQWREVTRGRGFAAAMGVLIAFLAMVLVPEWINAVMVGERPVVKADDSRVLVPNQALSALDTDSTADQSIAMDLTPLVGWTVVPGKSKDSLVVARGGVTISVKAASGVRDIGVYFDRQVRQAAVAAPSDHVSPVAAHATMSGLAGMRGIRHGEIEGEMFVIGAGGVAAVVDLKGPAGQVRQASGTVRELMDTLAVTR